MFSLICVWTNGWANNRDACDLRRHCAHCDVTVMRTLYYHRWKKSYYLIQWLSRSKTTHYLQIIIYHWNKPSDSIKWHCHICEAAYGKQSYSSCLHMRYYERKQIPVVCLCRYWFSVLLSGFTHQAIRSLTYRGLDACFAIFKKPFSRMICLLTLLYFYYSWYCVWQSW